jgi:putative acetyltransferase
MRQPDQSTHVTIRSYRPGDARALTDIFYTTIHTVGLEQYTEAEVHAWAPLPIDYASWQARFDALPPFVAEVGGTIVGYITLTNSGHIEWTYTHKDYQRRGIASALYRYLEAEARHRDLSKLTVDASHFARPFFEKHGFHAIRKNRVERQGQRLVNWTMEKNLPT